MKRLMELSAWLALANIHAPRPIAARGTRDAKQDKARLAAAQAKRERRRQRRLGTTTRGQGGDA